MKSIVTAALFVAFGATAALAGPIEDRVQIMKDVQEATKTASGYARGATPFDAAAVQKVLQVYVNAGEKLPTLFPANTKTGANTSASPKIWDDAAGFKAASLKFSNDAKTAMKATDQASFATAFRAITMDCASCHGEYRVKK